MRVIVNADDFGLNHNKTIAIDWGIRHGFIQRASLIVNTGSLDEAVALAKSGHYMDRICFHLNLCDGAPLTESIKQTDVCNREGIFCRCPNKRFQLKCFHDREIKAIRQECEEQMRLFREKGFSSDHIDSHRWCLCNFPVWIAVHPLLKKYGFHTIRTMNGHLLNYENGKLRTYYSILQRFIRYSSVSASESWAGVTDEFLKQVVPSADHNNDLVEVYVHPDMINDTVTDIAFSYKWEKRPLKEIFDILSDYLPGEKE